MRCRRSNMTQIYQTCKQLMKDEGGGEVLEYAIVTGLIVIAAISLIGQVGVKVMAKWTSINSKL